MTDQGNPASSPDVLAYGKNLHTNLCFTAWYSPPLFVMPRPKIRPEDRKRSCKACVSCKASKIRCDSRLPCATCVRRGQSAACVYTGTDRRRTRHSEAISHQSNRSSEDPSTDVTQLVDASPIMTPLPQLLASSSDLNGRCSEPETRPSASSTKQKSICSPSFLS